MDKIKILWADDEIDLLKPQLFFLEKKGYNVITVSNGHDALDEFEKNGDIDIIFLDESMPGLSGLQTMQRLKAMKPTLPIVMITKNEAEHIALKNYPGARVTAARLEKAAGGLIWLIEIASPKTKTAVAVTVDAVSGRIVSDKNGDG